MAAVRILVDTDVFIDYFNSGRHTRILEDRRAAIYYSVVTRKELLGKPGLKDSERGAIVDALRRFRLVPLTPAIAARYAAVRREETKRALASTHGCPPMAFSATPRGQNDPPTVA